MAWDSKKWAIRAAAGNLKKARWFAREGNRPEEAIQLALDAMMFLGGAAQAGASTRGAAWHRLSLIARDIGYDAAKKPRRAAA